MILALIPKSMLFVASLRLATAGSPGILPQNTIGPFTPVYYAKLYGAQWNGVAVDTVPVQAAVTAAGNAGGGIVSLPVGTGLLDAIYVPTNVQIIGQGMGTTICKMAPTSTGDGMFLNKTYTVF